MTPHQSGVRNGDPLIVFVSGLYAPNGRDSVSIQTRDYLLGLRDRGAAVVSLDMAEQRSLSTLVRHARSIALHSSVRGWERAGIWTARQMLQQRWALEPVISAVRASRQQRSQTTAPVASDGPPAPQPDPELHAMRAMRLRVDKPESVSGSTRRVACIVNGYDLLFSPQWGSVWRRAVEIAIRRACPAASEIRWFVHVVNETSRVAPALVHGLQYFDEVWPAADFQIAALRKSGLVHNHVHKVGEAVDTSLFRPDVAPLAIPGRRRVCFLTLSQYGMKQVARSGQRQSTESLAYVWNHARKASSILVRAFLQEFRADEDVCLVIKSTYALDQLRAELAEFLASEGVSEARARQIIPIGGWTDRRELPHLYAACDAFALVSRGEGWGRPLAEAMAMRIPTIGTRFGGNTDFMTDENSYLVEYTSVPVSDTMGPKFESLGEWAEPSLAHLRVQLRAIASEPATARRRATQASHDIHQCFSREAVADAILGRVHARF